MASLDVAPRLGAIVRKILAASGWTMARLSAQPLEDPVGGPDDRAPPRDQRGESLAEGRFSTTRSR
jgi:hypothetical protein